MGKKRFKVSIGRRRLDPIDSFAVYKRLNFPNL